MNLSSGVVLLGLAATAWLIAFVAIRGRRIWLQAAYAACAVAFLGTGAAFIGTNEGLFAVRDDVVIGIMLVAHALTAILVLGLIHGESLPRQRAASFLLLAPVPVLAFLAPAEGWTVANAYEGNPIGGFLVLCLGIALAETVYTRSTSRLLDTHSFWLSLGVISLIVAGPLYTYELEILRQPTFGGANIAAPLALGCFALAALQADPFPASPRPAKGRTKPIGLRVADAIVFEERRPKYALLAGHAEATGGRATLVMSRIAPHVSAAGVSSATIVPGRHAALRTLTTASDFFGSAPGGLVLLEGLADLSALSGWRPTLEAVVRLRHIARGTGSTLILCPARLTDSERAALQGLHTAWWALPDPTQEIEAVLANSFGTGAPRLLDAFCRAHGLGREDLTPGHVPALLAFLMRALSELSAVVAGTAAHGLRVQFEAAASVLRAFAAQTAEDVARGKWPSRKPSEAGTELLVTAAEYWKGREMEELFSTAEGLANPEPLYERARTVFVEQFGDAGESVLRAQLARLGRRPEDLGPADLVRIADRASVDLGSLAQVVDVPAERERIQKQIESIRQGLELIAEERR